MRMQNKTLKEIEAGITPERIKKFKLAAQQKPDMSDPDALTPTKEMYKKAVRMGRPPKLNPKKSVYMYFDAAVVDHLRSTGKGWQTRVSDWIAAGVKKGAL